MLKGDSGSGSTRARRGSSSEKTTVRLRVLYMIYASGSLGIHYSDLAREAGVDEKTLNGLLGGLVKAGVVEEVGMLRWRIRQNARAVVGRLLEEAGMLKAPGKEAPRMGAQPRQEQIGEGDQWNGGKGAYAWIRRYICNAAPSTSTFVFSVGYLRLLSDYSRWRLGRGFAEVDAGEVPVLHRELHDALLWASKHADGGVSLVTLDTGDARPVESVDAHFLAANTASIIVNARFSFKTFCS